MMIMKGLIFRICIWLIILVLLPCFVFATKTSGEEDWSTIVNEKKENFGILSSKRLERKLQAVCEDGSKPVIHYFEVIVRIQPDTTVTGICTLADRMKLGSDINKILSSHAIGDSGIDQTVKFKAAVCTVPNQSIRRSLQLATFQWKGGGGCRGCPCDCKDGRRDLQFAVWGTTEWFNTVYAPQLESSIWNAIRTTVVPNHIKCLGTTPIVTVDVNKVSLTQLISRFKCQAGRLISLLETMSLSNIAVIDRMCDNCVTIDFSKASDGTPLSGGMDISQQWQPDGLTIHASSFLPFFLTTAKVLDTGNQMCLQLTAAQEYGSPNQSCPGGRRGIGWGNGGAVGTEGENCTPLGNVLILQDPFFWHTCPKPSFLGGKISFIFQTPVYFHDLGVFDMDELDSRLEITYSDDVVEYFNFVRFGDNAVQRVIVSKPNVKKLELAFQFGTGAITEISYCRVCEAKEGHDESHNCIIAGNVVNKILEVIEINNFEEPNILDALRGWDNGRINNGIDNVQFTKFLGLYSASDIVVAAPYKVFSVPIDAETIIVELDFYEIDNWNQDSMAIFVDGERIQMQFTNTQDERRQEGKTQLGVNWTSVSMDIPKPLGFSSSVLDQKHHITIEVPSTSQLYKDGQLRIKLWWGSTNPSSTALAGWDNIQVSVRHGCSLLDTTTETTMMTTNVTSNITAVVSVPQTPSPIITPTPNKPSISPSTKFPTNQPTMLPTNQPTKLPTNQPTMLPTNQPTKVPTNQPTMVPTNQPTKLPTKLPSNQPTMLPTKQPTTHPTNQPTKLPTNQPTKFPTNLPTNKPTTLPTNQPTKLPTSLPTIQPTKLPTSHPTNQPTILPTLQPTRFRWNIFF